MTGKVRQLRERWRVLLGPIFVAALALSIPFWAEWDADLPAEADAFLHDGEEEEWKDIRINLTDLLPSPDESWDEPPADWYDCMGRAYSMINYNVLVYANGTIVLTGKARSYSENAHDIANMHWHIAVCDRAFPDGTGQGVTGP